MVRVEGKDSTIIRITGGRRGQCAQRLTVQASNRWWKKQFLFDFYFFACVCPPFRKKYIKAEHKVEFIQFRVDKSVNQTRVKDKKHSQLVIYFEVT